MKTIFGTSSARPTDHAGDGSCRRDKPCLSGLRSKRSPVGRFFAAGGERDLPAADCVRAERRTSAACPYNMKESRSEI